MRLGWSKSKNSVTYRAIRSVRKNGKRTTEIAKTFGSEKYICETYGVTDAKAWAAEQVRLMNEMENDGMGVYNIPLSATKDLVMGKQICFNGGYLFLQDIYYELGLDKICKAISKKYRFEYDLNNILSRLIYTRILFPASKRSSYEDSKRFIEQPTFELHDIYRSLSVMAAESDYIQSRLFKNSTALGQRHTEIIYYDCTNFYFEIEQEEDDKVHGKSKENRPLPIVEMGLFMDTDGIPIAFSICPGNESEQLTMIPLEKKMIEKFDISKFVVCTDAGLSGATNRFFNGSGKGNDSRAFITTQSLKDNKLKKHLREWALKPDGWYLAGDKTGKKYSLNDIDEEADIDKVFYKRRWIKEISTVNDEGTIKKVPIEQQLIVSYSIKYRNYLRTIREGQIERAEKLIKRGEKAISRKGQNDVRKWVKVEHTTENGEAAEDTLCTIDQDAIDREAQYDGFYAVCTNLEDDPESIVKINKRRWQIEECFRIMKTEFKSRPVYVKLKDHILAHFITCFIALIVYRYLEKKLDDKYTIAQITDTLKEMNFVKYDGIGYQPIYTRSELTDDLHKTFGFCTSKEIIPTKKMRNFCAITKK